MPPYGVIHRAVIGCSPPPGMDFLGITAGVQKTIAAAVVWGVASVLKEHTPAGPAENHADVSGATNTPTAKER